MVVGTVRARQVSSYVQREMRGAFRMRRLTRMLCGIVCVVALPATAWAQASIAGTARDSSGAVLPGVTVEASSSVLIEKTRSVVTDGSGQYRITDLPPGVYSITYM